MKEKGWSGCCATVPARRWRPETCRVLFLTMLRHELLRFANLATANLAHIEVPVE
jgi:hypothetical protein